MTSTISCQTRKNNAPTTSSLPIITRGTHEDTASPPPPHAATACGRMSPHAAVFAAAAPALFAALGLRHHSLHVASAVVRCMPPHAAARPSACRCCLGCLPSIVCCTSAPPSFAALRRGGGSSQQLSSQPYCIVLYYKLSRQST